VQPDRLEIEVVAWGAGEQSWSIDYHIIYGDPDMTEEQAGSPWSELTGYLRKLWRHEQGVEIGITRTCIDSGGHNTQAVYGYAKRHKFSGVFAIKGRGGAGLPVIGAPNRRRSGKVKRPVDVFIVGVDNAKMTLRNRLKLDSPGAGYCHFPASREAEWFRQLVAEKLMTRYVKGFAVREWQKSNGVRNEALDCRVYAFAALVMQPPQFEKLALKLKRRSQTMPTEKPTPPPEPTPKAEDTQPTAQDRPPPASDTRPKKSKPPRSRGSFLNRWRN
jgi:phage terminase large subunit GpA-like protein